MTNHRASVAAARRASRRTFTGSASLAVIARQLLRVAAIGALTPLPVAAQITPGGTHAPTMDMAMNGTPVVRITTPDSAGISHNSYTQFNVDGRGLILNNSDQIVTTRLAGYVDGNRNIKTGRPATLILNEVVSTNPSLLAGYIEIAGPAAQLVLANANGITCNGCGFINAPWVTLTSGRAMFGPQGSLAGFAVDGGTLAVGGAGLDASSARLDLFARALSVNAGIWADRINAVTGSGDVTIAGSTDDIVVTARKSSISVTPAFALDVAAVGGMYARSIRLIGTEAGLGVRSAGTLASLEQPFRLTAAGQVELTGRVVSANTTAIETGGGLEVSGTLYGGKGTSLSAGGTFVNTGLTASGADLVVRATEVASTGTLVAGLRTDGSLGASGTLSLTSSGVTQLRGQTVAADGLGITAGGIELASGAVQVGGNADLHAASFVQARSAQLVVGGQLSLAAATQTNAGLLQGGAIGLSGRALTNTGTVVATGALSATLDGQLDNAGVVQSSGPLVITSAGLTNSATLVNVGSTSTTIATGGTLANSGILGGNGDVSLRATSVAVSAGGQIVAGGTMAATVAQGVSLAGGGSIAGGDDVTVSAGTIIDASAGGTLAAGGRAHLAAATIDTRKGQLTAGTLNATATYWENDGGLVSLVGGGDSAITVSDQLSNIGGTIALNGANAALSTSTLINQGGVIAHAGSGTLSLAGEQSLDNGSAGRIVTNGALSVRGGAVANHGGTMTGAGAVSVIAGGLLDNSQGTIAAGGSLAVTGAAVTNARGLLQSARGLSLTADTLDNSAGGTITQTGSQALTLRIGAVLDGRSGTIGGNGLVQIDAGSIDMGGTQSRLIAGGPLSVGAAGVLRLDGGASIQAAGDAQFMAGDLIGDGSSFRIEGQGTWQAGDLSLAAATLAAGAFRFDAGTIRLNGAAIEQIGTGDVTLSSAGTLDYAGATLRSAADHFTIRAADLSVDGGKILHSGSGEFLLDVTGTVSNIDGTIATNGSLRLAAGSLVNAGGIVSAAGDLDVTTSGALSGAKGSILAGGALSVSGEAIATESGLFQAAGPLSLSAGDLSARGGQFLSSDGAVAIVATGAVDLREAVVVGASAGTLRAAEIDAGGAQFSFGTGLALAATGGGLGLGGATLVADRVELTAAHAIVTDLAMLSSGSFSLSAATLSNFGGTLLGARSGAVSLTGTLANSGTLQVNGGDLLLHAGMLSNSGGIENAGAGAVSLVIDGALDNRATGQIVANGAVSVAAGTLNNAGTLSGLATTVTSTGALVNSGLVSGEQGVTIGSEALSNSGQIVALGTDALAVSVTGLLANSGTLGGNGDVSLKGDAIRSAGGTLSAAGMLRAQATGGAFSITGGTVSGANLSLAAASLIRASGGATLTTPGTLALTAQNIVLDGTGGATSASTNELALSAQNLMVTGGAALSIAGGSPLGLSLGGTLDLSGGSLVTNARDLTIATGTFLSAGGKLTHNGVGTLGITATTLTNSGSIVTAGAAMIAGDSGINTGAISAAGAGRIEFATSLRSSGTIVSGAALELRGGALDVSGGTLAGLAGITLGTASLDAVGGTMVAGRFDSPNDASTLNVAVTGTIAARDAVFAATGDAELTAGSVDLSGRGRLSARNVTAITMAGDLRAGQIDGGALALHVVGMLQANLLASGNIVVGAGLLDTSNAVLSAQGLTATLGGLNNVGGAIHVLGAGPFDVRATGDIENGGGRIETNAADLTLSSGSLNNNGGTIVHSGAGVLTVAASAALSNGGGMIGSNGRFVASAGSLVNTAGAIRALGTGGDSRLSIGGVLANGGTIQADAGALEVSAGVLANGTGTIGAATGSLDFVVRGAASNDGGGVIAGHGGLTLAAQSLVNAGDISTPGALTLTMDGTLANSGTITGHGVLATVGALVNDGKIVATGTDTMRVAVAGAWTGAGTLGGNGDLWVHAQSAAVSGGTVTAAGTLDLAATAGDFALAGGAISGGTLKLGATGSFVASAGAQLSTPGVATIAAGSLRLDGAASLQVAGLALDAGNLAVTSGAKLWVADTGPLNLSLAGTFDLSGGDLQANAADLTIAAGSFVATGGGTLSHHGRGVLRLKAGTFSNAATLQTDGTLALAATNASNAGTITAAGDAALTVAGALANGGSIVAGGRMTVTGGAIGSAGGTLAGLGGLSIDADRVNADGGRLLAGDFTAAGDANMLRIASRGAVSAVGATLAATGDATVTGSTIGLGQGGRLTGQAITATATAGDLMGAQISGTDLALSATGTLNGSFVARNGLTVAAGLLDTSGGGISAATLSTTIGALRNRGGSITVTGTGALSIVASGAIDNDGGLIRTNAGDLTLSGSTFSNAGGTISMSGTRLLALGATADFDNAGGTIATNGRYAITAANLTNDAGSLAATGASKLTVAGALSNRGGTLSADGGLFIDPTVIDNSQGIIASSGGDIRLVGGSLINTQGVIGGLSALASPTAAGGAVTITLSGALENGGGTIAAKGGMALSAGSLANQGGAVLGASGVDLDIAGLLDNGAGQIGGQSMVAIHSGTLLQGGTISGHDLALNIDRTLTTTGGSAIWADGTATVTAASLVNAGSIAGGQNLLLAAGTLDNGAGMLGGGTLLSLSYSSGTLGSLAAANDLALTVNGDWSLGADQHFGAARNLFLTVHGAIDNAGTIQANGTASVVADGSFANQASGTIKGGAVALASGGVFSNAGLINGADAVQLDVGSLTNSASIFGGSVAIRSSGDVANRDAGAVIATRGGTLSILTPGLVSNTDGANLYALGDLIIAGRDGSASGDWGRAGGLFNSSASIQASGSGLIAAETITNTRTTFQYQADEISGPTEKRINYGHPPGAKYDEFWLIYNDTVSRTSLTADSGKSIIAVGGNLDLSSGALLNQWSAISAGGNLTFTGGSITNQSFAGQERTVSDGAYWNYNQNNNHQWRVSDPKGNNPFPITDVHYHAETASNLFTVDASITAGGSMTINASSVLNQVLDDRGQQVSLNGSLGGGVSAPGSVAVGNATTNASGSGTGGRSVGTGRQSLFAGGAGSAVQATASAQGFVTVVDGVRMGLSGTQVAGTSGGARISGETRQLASGDAFDSAGAAPGAAGISYGFAAQGTNAASRGVAGGVRVQGTAVAALGNVVGVSLDGADLVGIAPSTMGGFSSVSGGPIDRAAAVSGMPARGTISGLSPSASDAFRVSLGGLFNFAAPGSSYLIGANQQFAAGTNAVSSNYYLDQLGYDPTRVQQRLGDAFYEQQLVAQQLTALTGGTRLAGYGDNQDQYQALLGSGAAYAKEFGLSLGVGLTAEQMASLTTDIVLLVDVVVEGPNGPTRALAPIVYLAKTHEGDLQESGALIAAGGQLSIRSAGDLTNSGVIRASLGSDIAVEGRLTNAGTIAGGKVATITAGGDLISQGGSFTGGDLTLSAGGNMVLGATRSTQHSATAYAGGGTLTDSITHQVTTVDATGKLTLVALGDLTAAGAKLSAGDSATLVAGGNITLGAVTDVTHVQAIDRSAKGTSAGSATSQTALGTSLAAANGITVQTGGALALIGSTIQTRDEKGGQITLAAGQGITIGAAQQDWSSDQYDRAGKKRSVATSSSGTTNLLSSIDAAAGLTITTPGAVKIEGATLNAAGALAVNAGSLTLGGVIDTADSRVDTFSKSSGLLSSTIKRTSTTTHDETVVASTLSGDTAVVTASGGVTITGANLVASNGLTLSAVGPVTIGTLATTDSQESSSSVKKSGFSLGGGGLFLGVAKTSSTGSTTDVTQAGSVIGTQNGDLTIVSGGALGITGSTVAAGGDVLLQGASVTIANTLDVRDSSSSSKSSSFGVSIGAYENISGAVHTLADLPSALGSAKGGAAALAINTASTAQSTVRSVMNAMTSTVGVSVSLGISSSRSKTSGEAATVVGASVTGDTVGIIATGGDLSILGSSVKGTNGVALTATGDVLIEAAQAHANQNWSSHSAGASLGLSLGVGIVGGATASATASVSSSSASGTSSQTHNVNSVVDGGTRLTIASGDDTKLVGANVSGGDVIVRTGGDLLLQSLQDIGRQSNSSSGFGMGVGISSTGPGGSLTPSLSAGTGGGNSALVDTRTTLTAKGGMLDVEVGGTTSVIGATLAALDSTGKKDSGLLALKTGELVVADIADRASSANGAFSISGTLGLGGKDSGVAGEARAGITPGSLSGSYADSSYAATQAGTIGHGLITVASPGGTLLDQINRDITKATIVTRDDRTAFQVDIDPGATKELGALIRGDAGGSVILQGAQNLADDPTRTLRLAIGELYAPFDGLVDSGAIDKLFSNVTKMVAGNRGVEQHQFSALMNDRELQGKSAGEIADILKDRLIGVAAFGEKGDREKVRVELSDPTSQLSKSVALQGEMIAYAQARGIKDAAGLVAAYAADQQARDARVQASAAPPPGASPEQIAQLGAIAVNSNINFGTRAATLVVSGQEFLEEHSGWASAVRYGSLALKGPAGAVATYGIDQGIAFIAQQSGAAELLNNLAAYVGSYGFELLRDGDITSLLKDKTERFEIDPGKQTFGASLTNGAATLLGMTVPVIKGVNGGSHGTVKLEGPSGDFHVDDLTSGPYNPRASRADLEDKYGAENVRSTTTPSTPHQRVNSDPTKGIEVITDGGGGKAVRVQFDDPVTGAPLTANIPYDARGLPIFDDVSKYTTSIDTKFSYSAQMAKATRDLRDAINSGKVDSSQFSENQLKQINSGQPKIDDYTWHHNAQSSPNNMQLIPAVVHDAVIHSGQKSLNSGK